MVQTSGVRWLSCTSKENQRPHRPKSQDFRKIGATESRRTLRLSSRQAGLSMASGQTGHMLRGPRTGTGCSDILIRNPTDPVIHTESAYMPTLFVVAGPNGSGKSTLTRKGGFRGAEVIDPDTLARDMPSGEAAREALRHRRLALEEHRSHLVETTLAGTGIIRHIGAARREYYRVTLQYISLSSPDQALDRIRSRVALGGHDVPEVDVRRRFRRSYSNLSAAIALADEFLLYDNSNQDQPHQEMAIYREGALWISDSAPDWAVRAAQK